MIFGRYDGALYMIEWGSGFNGNNADAQIVRIDYTGGQVNPVAKATATPLSGARPLTVKFSSAGPRTRRAARHLRAGPSATARPRPEPNPTHTYTEEGNFTAILVVTGRAGPHRHGERRRLGRQHRAGREDRVAGRRAACSPSATASPTRSASTTSRTARPPRAPSTARSVVVELILGHDDHGHPMQQQTGCEGSFVFAARRRPHRHRPDHLRARGPLHRPRLAERARSRRCAAARWRCFQPKRKQAEHHDQDGTIRHETAADPLGGAENIGFLTDDMSVVVRRT